MSWDDGWEVIEGGGIASAATSPTNLLFSSGTGLVSGDIVFSTGGVQAATITFPTTADASGGNATESKAHFRVGGSIPWNVQIYNSAKFYVGATFGQDVNDYMAAFQTYVNLPGGGWTGLREKQNALYQAVDNAGGYTIAQGEQVGNIHLQAIINQNVTNGYVQPFTAEAKHYSDGSATGGLTAGEFTVFNYSNTTIQPPDAVANSTTNLWLGSRGTNRVFAAIAQANSTSGWYYGLYLRKNTIHISIQSSLVAGSVGIDFVPGDSNMAEPIRLPNAKFLRSWNSAGTSRYNLAGSDASDNILIGDTGANQPLGLQGANAWFFGSSGPGFGGGSLVIGITNASVIPSSNPSGGGILYAQGGALRWRGSAGTVTTIAPA